MSNAARFSYALLAATHPAGFTFRVVEAGNLPSSVAARVGRGTRSPLQFGHLPLSTPFAHAAQNVHSNEQIIAPAVEGERSRSQHSQPGRISSIVSLHLVACLHPQRCDPFAERRVSCIEPIEQRAIEIEHADDAALAH